jgi:methionyl-tRNA formyltransferase
MKFIYFGSSRFSCLVLEHLCSKGFVPSLIVTQPDQPQGRGLKILPTDISLFAEKRKIATIKPAVLKAPEVKERLSQEGVDYFVVTDYGKLLPEEILSLPKKLPLALHPSLLPLYRGAAPINWAIINGERETGVTIFKINDKIDKGEIILQKRVSIDDKDDIFSLTTKLAGRGAIAIVEAAEKIKSNNFALTPQDESKATLAPKLTKADGRINWEFSALRIRNLIRGTLGWPSAYTCYKDKVIKILEADALDMDVVEKPSTIVRVDREGIYVATSKGVLKITRVKPEGKKDMHAWAFVNGYRVKEREKLS